MKKIVTTLALASAFSVASQAQKNIDLAIEFINPTEGLNVENVPVGSEFEFGIKVKNLGPDAITANDTMIVYILGHAKAQGSGQYFYVPYNLVDVEIAAGEEGTFTLGIENGLNYGSADGDPVDYYFPMNAVHAITHSDVSGTFSYYADIIGWDVNGDLFNDEGIGQDAEGNATWGGNNVQIITGVTFGSTSSILNFANAKNINVFPNPTANQLNFAFDFEKSSNAAARVYDIAGRLVVSQDFGKQAAGVQNFTLDVTGLANGNYTLELTTDNNKGVSKFVIAK